MKITPEDMDAVRNVMWQHCGARDSAERQDMALASILVAIYDRGYREGYSSGYDAAQYDASNGAFG